MLNLIEGEQVIHKSKPHFVLSHLLGLFIIVLMGLGGVGQLIAGTKPEPDGLYFLELMVIPILIISVYIYLRHLTTVYIVTNKRVHKKHGILVSRVNEVFFEKINSVSFEQSLWHKLFQSGHVLARVGHDKPLTLKHVVCLKTFQNLLKPKA